MKISIITVCLNEKDTIEATLLSVFNQTFKDVELIVVDGLSTDGTLDIIDKYKDNIARFVSESDSGLYNAMNKGISLATGDYLLFLNANDSLYNNNVLENVANCLDKNPQAKMLYGKVNFVSEDGSTSDVHSYEQITNHFALLENNICHQSIFYNLKAFHDFGAYHPDYKIWADYDCNMNLLIKNRLKAVYLPIIISNFQMGGICTSASNKIQTQKERRMLLKKYFPKYKSIILANDFLKRSFGSIYNPIVNNKLTRHLIKSYRLKEKYRLNVTLAEG